MTLSLPLALDAMGGDKAPLPVIQGARLALRQFPELKFIFFGDENEILPILSRYRRLRAVSEVVHTEERISMATKPVIALRQGRKSSMRLAIDAVAQGKACAIVSAGNTGALMAMAKVVLKTLKGIARPAITASIPTQGHSVVMLDLGANIDCTGVHLLQFAIMGDAYARAMYRMDSPRVGLLNVGSEDMKGHDEVKIANQILREGKMPIDYHGFVEGHDILEGTVDVVVTDGFTGNIALKTAEGASKLIYRSIKDAIKSSVMAKLGFLLMRRTMKRALYRFDPRLHNGAILLGLNGIVVKSHGSTDAKGFANAIKVAVTLVEKDINTRILEDMKLTGLTQLLSSRSMLDESELIVPESLN